MALTSAGSRLAPGAVTTSPRGTVVDYLRIPSEYLNNWNHLIPVPRSLY